MENNSRRSDYKRNTRLEEVLSELSALLGPAEEKLLEKFESPARPVLLLVGGPRSGSTVFMQYLASLGVFAYPSNLLSRFYSAPYIGAKTQLLLTHPDYNFKDELIDLMSRVDFVSDLGKSKGALQPSEFWYFWKRFIPVNNQGACTPATEENTDTSTLRAELAALESVFGLPLAMKAILIEQDIPFYAPRIGPAIFVYLKRHPLYRIQSLLQCRERFFGSREQWYSTKPREFEKLRNLDPVSQVAGQVFYGDAVVADGLQALDDRAALTIGYEDFCGNPEGVYETLRAAYARWNCTLPGTYNGPGSFESANVFRLADSDAQAIESAYSNLSGQSLRFD